MEIQRNLQEMIKYAESLYDHTEKEGGYNQALCDLISLAYNINYYDVERYISGK